MKNKAMTNKIENRVAATLQLSRTQKLNSTDLVQEAASSPGVARQESVGVEKIYPRKIKTTIFVKSETVENLRSLADLYCTGVNSLIIEALSTANLQILDTCFEGLSEKEFLDKFPDLPSAECKSGGGQLLCKLPSSTRLCAEIFAVASNQSLNSYINTAICKALANFSASRLRHFQRLESG